MKNIKAIKDNSSKNLPTACLYEKSYMHKDTVTHVIFNSISETLITGSTDGQIKFWKKKTKGIDFIKHYNVSNGGIDGLAISKDGQYCASVSESHNKLEVFHVISYDLISTISLVSIPSGVIEWCHRKSSPNPAVAVGLKHDGDIHIFNLRDSANPVKIFKIHRAPVTAICFNDRFDTVISTDLKGLIEYWRPYDGSFPESEVNFRSKIETNLYDMSKDLTYSNWLGLSTDGQQFVLFSSDKKIRVIKFKSGKIRRLYNESLESIQINRLTQDGLTLKLESSDFGRRIAIERAIRNDTTLFKVPSCNAILDETGQILIYTTSFGIKYVNLGLNKVIKLLGKLETKERFLHIALYQGSSFKTDKRSASIYMLQNAEQDHTIFALAYRKIRFYLFTQREPEEKTNKSIGRDNYNEKLNTEIIQAKQIDSSKEIFNHAIIHTSRGEVWIDLYPIYCPITVENFVTHSKNGFYNGHIFHRVVKGFMIQTGDPLGNGSGGQSIWGVDFKDEIVNALRNDRAGSVSMANAGPNTNGSQFFITTVPCPWLDGKHTIFGRVIKGMDVIRAIENVNVDRDDKPVDSIKIMNIEIK